MKLFVYEWKKVFRQKSMFLLLLFGAALNILFLNFSEKSNIDYTAQNYCQLWEDISYMPDDEAYDMLENKYNSLQEANRVAMTEMDETQLQNICVYTGEIWTEIQLIQDVKEEVYTSVGYQDYLKSIQEDAKQMMEVSIFHGKSSYSIRNIQKTSEDFQNMNDLNLEASKSKGVTMATGFIATDFIAILCIFVLCVFLVLQEKQSGQFALIFPTPLGHRQTVRAKVEVLALGICIIYFVLYAGNFVSALSMYGFGDLSRVVQTVPKYQSSPLRISVGEYFILFTVVKLLIYFVSGLLCMLICLYMRNWLEIVISVLSVFCVNLVAYDWIPENSIMSSLKYLNLFSFLKTDDLLMNYRNINLFNHPISSLPIAVTVMVILVGILLLGLGIKSEKIEIFWTGKQNFIRKKHNPVKKSLGYFELLKVRKKCALGLLLLVLAAIQIFRIYHFSYFNDPDEVYYRSYMNYLSELSDSDLDDYVAEENERYETLMAQEITDENREQLYQAFLPYKGWLDTLSEYERIQSNEELTIVYPTGFLQLMGENQELDMISAILLMIILSICLPVVFSGDYDRNMNLLISTTAQGKWKTLQAKKTISFGVCSIIFWGICISDFLMIYYHVGMQKFNASLQSISLYDMCSTNWKIWQYFVVLYLIKFLGVIAAMHGIWIVSQILRDTMRSVLVSVLFMIPALFGLLGVDAVANLTLIPLLNGNLLLNECLYVGNIIPILKYLICVVIGMLVVNIYLNWKYRE